jgi:hypothetical protein
MAEIAKKIRSWRFLRWISELLRSFPGGHSGHKNDPNATLDFLEIWSRRATLLILAGIIIDIILAIRFSREFWELLGAIAANSLIGIGLIVEYIVIGMTIVASGEAKRLSDEKIAESNRQAAEANQKASEANQKAQEAILELAKFRAPRRLTGQQMVRTAEKLKQFSGTEYDVALQSNDPELMEFLYFIEFTLLKAGWKAISWAAPVAVVTTSRGLQAAVGISVTNVVVGMHPEQVSLHRPAAQCLADELMAAGINAMAAPMPWINANATAIHILIGRKL